MKKWIWGIVALFCYLWCLYRLITGDPATLPLIGGWASHALSHVYSLQEELDEIKALERKK